MEKKKRTNTYTNKDYLKIIVLSKTKDISFALSKNLSLGNEEQRGCFYSSYLKTQLIIFPRYVSKLDHQATTVAVEGLIVFITNRSEFDEIKSVIGRYNQVPIRILTSRIDCSDLARELNAYWIEYDESEPRKVVDYLNSLDMEEFQRIKESFSTYDKDGNGSIEVSEMNEIARNMGEDPESDEFKKSLLALDLNQDGNISQKEFILWWKIGRQNSHALPKIYDLFVEVQKILQKNLNISNFSEMITKVIEEQIQDVSHQKILFRTPGLFKPKTKLELSIAIGAEVRQNMALKFLSQFTKNTNSAKSNWISIYIPLNQGKYKINPSKAKFLLDEFKEHCISWGEKNMGQAFTTFIKNLVVFETNHANDSVILAIRLKLDIEDLVKSALGSLIYVLHNFQPDKKSTYFNIKVSSNLDLYDSIKKETNMKDFLDTCEVEYEGLTYKEQIRSFYTSLSEEEKEKLFFLQALFHPNNLEVEYDCKLSDFYSFDDRNSFLNTFSLKDYGKFIDFLKNSIPSELLHCASNIELCLNAFDVFARLKIYSKSLFSAE